MRHLICFVLLLWASPAFAQNAAPKANTLTPKEIAEGWLLLFDGDSDFGWSGDRKTDDGKLAVTNAGMKSASARHGGQFQDFELQFDYSEVGAASAASLNLLRDGQANHPVVGLPAPKESAWCRALVTVAAGQITAKIVNADKSTINERFPLAGTGSVQLEWTVAKGSTLYLKNVKLRPRGLKSIFNGKDLAGWKEFPGKKSKFSITPGGEINIKDGPGDLQTEAKYDDFVLQLECISNGKHLNSGVFFRCRANEYQNGYEAQIRNQFTAEPTQEYTLEDYDPLTHKLVAKKKAKFTAVDYGTGAIYRRQPARKEVAKDGQWFTFTVLAHKNHFLTWVNGIQVADWTDNRPPSDNARTGCRLEAGHLSLQGHDPTTDLSFRSFRIAAIK
ncbi:MAG TPA: DUF1080 domain-containing protein [Gemmataceae bacterium]|nr:DUF1080 domain-containing protein [Gemmataceae bacterium]